MTREVSSHADAFVSCLFHHDRLFLAGEAG